MKHPAPLVPWCLETEAGTPVLLGMCAPVAQGHRPHWLVCLGVALLPLVAT